MARTRIIYSHTTGKKMAEYKDGELIWWSEEFHQPVGPSHYVQGDLQPYRSTVTGEMIEGRAQHRTHLKQHRLIEIGNETKHLKSKPLAPPPGRKELLIEVVNSKLRSK